MPSVNEKIKDQALEYSVQLLRFEGTLDYEVRRRLNALINSLTNSLSGSGIWNAKRKQTVNRRMVKFFKKSKRLINSTYLDIDKQQRTNLITIAKLSQQQVNKTIDEALKVEGITNKSTSKPAKLIDDVLIEGSPISELWKRRSTAFDGKFKDTIRDEVSKGSSLDAVMLLLVGTAALRYKDSIFNPNRASAQSLARTALVVVANQTKLDTFVHNTDIVKAIEWVSTLDSRTTKICMALDGLQWTMPGYQPIKHNKRFPGAAAHYACRSTQVPVTKSDKELGISGKFGKIPESTRASMDGQVSAKLNYENWLKTKNKAFQMDVLGPNRYKLWHSGKLGFTDLTGNSGNVLTLVQLKKRL